MWCNQIFSLINEQEVKNIIVCDNYEVANQIARLQLGEESYAVDTTQYPLSIGCKHLDNVFYEEDGVTVIERNETVEEETIITKARVDNLENRQSESELNVDYRLSILELGLI